MFIYVIILVIYLKTYKIKYIIIIFHFNNIFINVIINVFFILSKIYVIKNHQGNVLN
jgi:hypothetical protein